MLQALLAATDPLGVVDAGAPAALYDRTVAAVLDALASQGCARTAALGFLLPHAEETARPRAQRAAERFAAAAEDWWRTQHARIAITPPVAAAARTVDRPPHVAQRLLAQQPVGPHPVNRRADGHPVDERAAS